MSEHEKFVAILDELRETALVVVPVMENRSNVLYTENIFITAAIFYLDGDVEEFKSRFVLLCKRGTEIMVGTYEELINRSYIRMLDTYKHVYGQRTNT